MSMLASNGVEEYQIQQPKRKRFQMVGWGVLLLMFLALASVLYFFTKVNRPASLESRPASFMVRKGMTTKQIAFALSDSRIINSPWVFMIYTTMTGAAGRIEAGDYALNRTMTIKEITAILTLGKVVSQGRFIVIEGWTNDQIGQYLSSHNILGNDEFMSALERKDYNFKFVQLASSFKYQGFLFPDTYQLSKDPNGIVLVNQMLKNFQSKITDQMLADLEQRRVKFSDAIVLASIVEKEVGRNKTNLTDQDVVALQRERELVASVFYNRLQAGMPLESDATVNYITGKSDRQVSLTDAKIKSPYNTYLYKGLPPTPISNPGFGSIMAAVYPAKSDYLYFLNKPDGEAVFARTLAEQNANKAKYLR